MVAVPSEEFRTVLWMFVILLTTNFKIQNRFNCSKGPIKRAGKVCEDFSDLKSPGKVAVGRNIVQMYKHIFQSKSQLVFQALQLDKETYKDQCPNMFNSYVNTISLSICQNECLKLDSCSKSKTKELLSKLWTIIRKYEIEEIPCRQKPNYLIKNRSLWVQLMK